MTEETDFDDGQPRPTPWLLWLTLVGMVAAAVAFSGCATSADVDAVRKDLIDAKRAEKDAFTGHLVEHPGDVQGAVAKGYGVSLSKQKDARDDAASKPSALQAGVEAAASTILGIPTGGALGGVGVVLLGVLAKWLDSRAKKKDEEHDAAPFVGPNGERVDETRIVAATLKVEAGAKP